MQKQLTARGFMLCIYKQNKRLKTNPLETQENRLKSLGFKSAIFALCSHVLTISCSLLLPFATVPAFFPHLSLQKAEYMDGWRPGSALFSFKYTALAVSVM
jgi:hypothetical protein